MNVLEIAIYAMVISGQPQALQCAESDLGNVNCTNGLSASEDQNGHIQFSNGVKIDKITGVFSNGITAHRDSTGWLEFSNGLSVHRDTPYRYRIGNRLTCLLQERTTAVCQEGQ